MVTVDESNVITVYNSHILLFFYQVLNTAAKTADKNCDKNSSESEIDELKKKIQEIDNQIKEMGIE